MKAKPAKKQTAMAVAAALASKSRSIADIYRDSRMKKK